MVINTLVSGMWTSITSGSGLARGRLGTDSSRQAKSKKRVGPWSMVTVFAGWLL